MTDSEAERARLAASAATARHDFARIETATAPAREQLAAATAARRSGTVAAHRRSEPPRHDGLARATGRSPRARRRRSRATSAPSNTSNKPGTAPARTSTSTTRPEHASSEAQTALDRHDTRVWLRRTPDQVAGPATTGRSARAVESMGPRRHHQPPATRRHHRTAHQPQSPRRARRPVPSTRPSGTGLGRRRRHRPAIHGATQPNPRTNRARTRPVTAAEWRLDPVARDPRPRGRRSPHRSEAGEWRKPGLADRLRRTKSAWVVPRVPSIQPESGGIRSAWRYAGGRNADGWSSDVRYHQPANRPGPPENDNAWCQALGQGVSRTR